MRDIITGGLLLPLRLYFQPIAFGDEVAALAPDFPRDYSLWQARHKLREPVFRRGLRQLILQALVALVWIPVLLGLLSALGYGISWKRAAVAVASTIVAGAMFGAFGGMAGTVAASVLVGVVTGIAYGAAVGVLFGLAVVAGGGVAVAMAGGIAVSVSGTVEGAVVVSVVSSIATGVLGDVAFGVAIGVGLGVPWSVAVAKPANTASNISRALALLTAGAVAAGAMTGAGVNLVAGMPSALTVGVTVGVVSVIMGSHLIFFPLQLILSLMGLAIIRTYPKLGSASWRISPVRWDESILVPLPGLVDLLVTLDRTDPKLGRKALAEVAAHRYQSRAAQKALVGIAREEAMLVTTLPALAAFGRGLDWLTEEAALPGLLHLLLPKMRDISHEVGSALQSDSATNRVRRFTTAVAMLEPLRLQPGAFGTALARWSRVLEEGLDESRRRQQVEEPIPQVYIIGGRPIRPGDRPDTALPFKGRSALFRQLEAGLGGKDDERTTFVLYGQRRTGKSSALMQLPRRLGSQFVPAFLDLQSGKLASAENVAGLLRGLAEGVREEARYNRGVRLPALDLTALADDPYPAFGRWLDQVENVLGERTLLLCLDEFEELEYAIRDKRLDTRILSTIRNIVQYRRRVAVLLSGSHQIDELPPHWASALISTNTLPISFLEEGDARELIEDPVADFPKVYTPAAVDRIVGLTHCQPYLVQLVCGLLVERMNRAHRNPPAFMISVDDVEAIIPTALGPRSQGYFSDLWRTETGSDLACRILEAMTNAPNDRISRAAIRQLKYDEVAVREAIAALLRREIIERENDGYRITVPLVAAYIRDQTLT